MTQQYVPNLGQEPAADARRDAVHVAVAPIRARHQLQPGDHVGLATDKQGRTRAFYVPVSDSRAMEEAVGIVDPFRTGPVEEEGLFWLFLYPNTVTSLRHVWTHPAFSPKPILKDSEL